MNVRERESEVPTPPVGMFTSIDEEDTTVNTDTANVPTFMSILPAGQVKPEPATVILAPGARTRGDMLEMVCAEQWSESDNKKDTGSITYARDSIIYAQTKVGNWR